MNEIPLLLKCLMEEANMTPAQLAKRAGVGRSMISRIFDGSRLGSIDGLNRLFGVFGCQITARRILKAPDDIDSASGKFKRPFDDPIENNPGVEKAQIKHPKTERP